MVSLLRLKRWNFRTNVRWSHYMNVSDSCGTPQNQGFSQLNWVVPPPNHQKCAKAPGPALMWTKTGAPSKPQTKIRGASDVLKRCEIWDLLSSQNWMLRSVLLDLTFWFAKIDQNWEAWPKIGSDSTEKRLCRGSVDWCYCVAKSCTRQGTGKRETHA